MFTFFTLYLSFIVDSTMIVMSRLLLHAVQCLSKDSILDRDSRSRSSPAGLVKHSTNEKSNDLNSKTFYITYYCSSIKGIGSETTLKSHAVAFRTSSTVIFGAISISVKPVPFVLSTSNTQRSVMIRSTTL